MQIIFIIIFKQLLDFTTVLYFLACLLSMLSKDQLIITIWNRLKDFDRIYNFLHTLRSFYGCGHVRN